MSTKSISLLLTSIAAQLKPVYENDILCTQYAQWILEAITNQRFSLLLSKDPIELNQQQKATLNDWLDKLIHKHIPLQYLLGSVPFNDINILVEPPVLIPRPETEEWVINLIQKIQNVSGDKLTILDLCTGSGCIALALAKALPKAMIYASDISNKALELAKKNATHNKLSNIEFIKSDLFTSITTEKKYDLIVTNPPYITKDEWQKMDPSVTQWEDPRALVASKQGLEIIEKIIIQAPKYIQSNDELRAQNIPQLVIEIGYKQGQKVKNLMENADYSQVKIEKDLFGNDRIVTGRVK